MSSMLSVREMVTFIPARDFEASRRFYADLFKVNWESGGLCQIQAGTSKFLVQDYYQKDWAENSMYQLFVDDAQATWEKLQSSGVL